MHNVTQPTQRLLQIAIPFSGRVKFALEEIIEHPDRSMMSICCGWVLLEHTSITITERHLALALTQLLAKDTSVEDTRWFIQTTLEEFYVDNFQHEPSFAADFPESTFSLLMCQ